MTTVPMTPRSGDLGRGRARSFAHVIPARRCFQPSRAASFGLLPAFPHPHPSFPNMTKDTQTALTRFETEAADRETDAPDVEALVDRIDELEAGMRAVAETAETTLDNLDTVVDRLEAIESPAGHEEPAETNTETDPAFH